jgi:hypothetical protein
MKEFLNDLLQKQIDSAVREAAAEAPQNGEIAPPEAPQEQLANVRNEADQ